MRRRLVGLPEAPGLGATALAPLVDVLTLLLVFLLRAWSTDPPVVVADALFHLPRTVSEESPPPTLTVDVSPRGMWVDGTRVVGTAYYAQSDEMLVREVYDPVLQRAGTPVSLRVDGEVEYAVLRKVLFTLREAGVTDVALIAESRAGL